MQKPAQSMKVLFGEVSGHLVFIPEPVAWELADLRDALDSAETWGDLRASVTDARWRQIQTTVIDGGEDEVPSADEPFEPQQLPGYEDGDWPEWPAQQMLEWVPESIQEHLGSVEASTLNGPFLAFDPGKIGDLLAAFVNEGFECACQQDVVARASGN